MPIHLKLSKKELPEGCWKQIKAFAKAIDIYDPNFPDEDQCSGFYAFFSLCLIREELGVFPEDKYELHSATQGSRPGVYLLTKLHEGIRRAAWEAAKYIKKEYFTLKPQTDE